MAEFGENVRSLRQAKGLTQQSLADQLYVTRQAVSRWEGGSRYPDLMTAKKLAEALDSTMDALSLTPRAGNVAILLLKALAGGCVVRFFLQERPSRPWTVYAICAGSSVLSLVSAAYRIHVGFDLEGEMGGLLTVNALVTASALLATLCLLGVMAWTLYRKRRQAA